MCRDALLHRSHEIQPALYDSAEKSNFFAFFCIFFFFKSRDLYVVPDLGGAGCFASARSAGTIRKRNHWKKARKLVF